MIAVVTAACDWVAAPAAGETTRTVTLHADWNSVVYTGQDVPAATLVTELGVEAIFVWDATTQQFAYFHATLPAALNSFQTITTGSGLWIKALIPQTWTMEVHPVSTVVPLRAGWNHVPWATVDTVPVTDAVASIGTRLQAVYRLNPSGRFDSFLPALPARLSSLMTVSPFDALWVIVSAGTPVAWTQTIEPSPGFRITSPLCFNDRGPDCTRLRLGDDYLSTSAPARGYLYSCVGKNPNAPGAIESKITWINFTDQTWNFLDKLWLPRGTFAPHPGTYAEAIVDGDREIIVNNLPVDGNIGDWPMTAYPALTAIDPNPGIPLPRTSSFSYTASPSASASPACVSPGAIGVTKNGVVLYNAADGRGEDAMAREITDEFGGHPAMTTYHYHVIPERLDNETLASGHSGIVGYIKDGFAIYGYRGEGGAEISNGDLDRCHGHDHSELGYHYHATIEYPYTVGCYMGDPNSSSLTGPPPGGGPPP